MYYSRQYASIDLFKSAIEMWADALPVGWLKMKDLKYRFNYYIILCQ